MLAEVASVDFKAGIRHQISKACAGDYESMDNDDEANVMALSHRILL